MSRSKTTVGKIRDQVPYTRLQAAINAMLDACPKREIPGMGETPWPVISREEAPDFLERLRANLGMARRPFYTRLAASWYRIRGEAEEPDEEVDHEQE